MFRIEVLKNAERERFASLTFPLYRGLLRADLGVGPQTWGSAPQTVAVGARVNGGTAAGLALAQVFTDEAGARWAQVHSVAVAAARRRAGLGSALLGEMEKELAGCGCELAHGTYMSGTASCAAVEALLRKREWEQPYVRKLICESDLAHIRAAPFMRFTELGEGFTATPWCKATAAELERIRGLEGAPGWHHAMLGPFVEEPVEPGLSLALREANGDIAGWVIWTVFDSETVRCARMFVRSDLQRAGRGIALVVRSILLGHGTKWRRAMFDVEIDNTPMVRFVRRRMAPYLTVLKETRGSWKRLGAEEGAA